MMGVSVSWVQGFTEVRVAVKELSLGYNNQKTDHLLYTQIWPPGLTSLTEAQKRRAGTELYGSAGRLGLYPLPCEALCAAISITD